MLHRICHRQIHALFSETELARQYNTAEALLAHPEVDLQDGPEPRTYVARVVEAVVEGSLSAAAAP